MPAELKPGYRECPWCHQAQSNIYGHAKTCKARPEGAVLPTTRRRTPRQTRQTAPRKAIATPRPPKAVPAAETQPARRLGCVEEVHAALSAAEKALATSLIRAGLDFDGAIGALTQARAVYGR